MKRVFGFERFVKGIVSLALVMPMTACNEFEPTTTLSDNGSLQIPDPNAGGGNQTPIDTNVGLESLNKDIDAMEVSIQDVETQIAKIDLPILMSQNSNNSSQSLSKELRGVFTKLYDSIALVYGKVGEIRIKINEQLAKLDPANPLHMAALIKLREYMKYLDDLEVKMAEVVNRIAGKVDEVVAKIEGKIATMDMKNPLTWAVMIVWEQVKSVFFEFRDKLIQLAKT